MVETKYAISNPHENQRFSGEIVTLVDSSTATVNTDSLHDFIAFVESENMMTGAPHANLFAGPEKVSAYAHGQITRETTPFAVLNLETHPRLRAIIQANKKPMSPIEAEEFLRRLRDGLDAEGKSLMLKMRDLKLSKKLEIEQKKERNGSYSFSQKLESGPEDWTPPERIYITVPCFNFIEQQIRIPFDFSVSLHETGEGKESKQSIGVKFECLDIDEHLLNGRRAIVTEVLASHKPVWGSMQVNKFDNAWSLVHNHAEGFERLKG